MSRLGVSTRAVFSSAYRAASASRATTRITPMRSASTVRMPVSAGNAENIAPATQAPNSVISTKSVARSHTPSDPDAKRRNGRIAEPASETANARTQIPSIPRTESVVLNAEWQFASTANTATAIKPANESKIPITINVAINAKEGITTS